MTGRYKAYSEYKEYNSAWFDFLPSHWQSVSLKWTSHLYSGGTPSKDNLSFWENGSIPWLNSGAVNQSLIEKPSAFITRDAFNNSSAKWIPKQSLVMALAGQGKTKGMVAQLAIDSTCNQSMAAIVPSKDISSRFLFWWLTSNYQKIRNMAGGDLRDGLNLELLGSISSPIFDRKEQQKIANFLDHETAKIDTLIAKQEKLIELIQEKRQAVISNAVTKGLNPDVPMKDSGVEWLGEVPEHWDRSRLGFECSVKARLGWKGLKADEYVPEGYIFLATPNIKGSDIDFENVNYITKQRYDESPEIMLQENDLLVTKDGSTTGTTNLVRSLPEPATVNSSIAVIRSRGNIHPEYLYYFFVSTYTQNVIKRMQGGMGVPHLFQADLRWFHILLPSNIEQKSIAKYLDIQTAKCDLIIKKATNAIQLMKERKTALILAAVTGKIDVRDWQPKGIQ
ncbi:restriction endonuclease subunit S [Providencia hangzhouensis]|uniref:Type I restriction enzyme EcoKI specificity protein n=1 Tax=Providencia rettgeri TaxID=587 RepID=A0A9N8GZV5_PRORE|nr:MULTISPECIES: restriction endonuclease subunit S [Providencia]EKH6496558.1 restriction endonuclease subunit S [Providencia rettgeri]ELR5052046.1 restriction endonuclease subunit S [Providencia rettgeri]ELR5157159.1 restriction endonuclease subunit S [Providencia rettgeri]ELR5182293.1 restriction endonuclease subunit S [Providencia rettgeri]ELR5222614.1 restriction endonuclease subunit S [Providencia rettgeri]